MRDVIDLSAVLCDLIDAMHVQAKELERLSAHLELQTGPLPYKSELSVVVSELSELQVRLQGLKHHDSPHAAPA